jgi:DNA-binding transcriptional regulator YdaS (Cro superfamily)
MAALARTLGVSPGAVWKWRNFDRIPAERVIAIERATNGLVTRAELRPDLFGEDVEAD